MEKVKEAVIIDRIERKRNKWSLITLSEINVKINKENFNIDHCNYIPPLFGKSTAWFTAPSENLGINLFENLNPLRDRYIDENNKYDFIINYYKLYWKLKTFRIIDWILENFTGELVVAGGFVSKLLYKNDSPYNDVDIFFYGISKKRANKILELIAEKIKEFDYDSYWSRNDRVLTAYFKGRFDTVFPHQFILNIFETKDQIIGNFDLGISSVMMDYNDIYFTYFGAICHILKCNIVDSSKASKSYERRLYKYFSEKIENNLGLLSWDVTEKLDMCFRKVAYFLI